jgi:hypothetical protein
MIFIALMPHIMSNMVLGMVFRYQVHSPCMLSEAGRHARDLADMTRVLCGMKPRGMVLLSYNNDYVAHTLSYHGMRCGMKSLCACVVVPMCNFGGLPCVRMLMAGRHISGNMYCRPGSTSPAHPCSHEGSQIYCHSTKVQAECSCA